MTHGNGYIDVSHTSHTTSSTGIQRVTRSIVRHIQRQKPSVRPVTYDPFQDAWRTLKRSEHQCLFLEKSIRPGSRRRARWTTRQRLYGVIKRKFLKDQRNFLKGSGPFDFVVFPEIFSREIGNQIKEIRPEAGTRGVRVGIFHDAIAWKFPEWSAQKTVDRYPEYMRSLAELDGIAAVSECSANDLKEFWDSTGIPKESQPPIRTVYLGSDLADRPQKSLSASEIPVVLCVATLEARKNHLALLSAAAHLWHQGYKFKLELIGAQNRETGVEAAAAVERIKRSGFPLVWHGAASDSDVQEAYQRTDFVVYPSLYEGFGLPIVEALRFGKPVLTTDRGSLREITQSGGCHVIENPTGSAIAQGLKALLDDKEYLNRLQNEASNRSHRSWEDYTLDILEFIRELSVAKA